MQKTDPTQTVTTRKRWTRPRLQFLGPNDARRQALDAPESPVQRPKQHMRQDECALTVEE